VATVEAVPDQDLVQQQLVMVQAAAVVITALETVLTALFM
jgi:hypothetical protein